MLRERVHAMKIVCHRETRWLQTLQIYSIQVNRWLGPKVQWGFAWRTMMRRKSEIRKTQKKTKRNKRSKTFFYFWLFLHLHRKAPHGQCEFVSWCLWKQERKKTEANGKTLHLKSNNFLFKAIAQTSVRASSTIVSTLHRALYVYNHNKQQHTQTVISCVHLIVKVF